jgi:hypothetical protein
MRFARIARGAMGSHPTHSGQKGNHMLKCYMCDRDKVDKEHVPPKCLFPEEKDLPAGVDLRKNLMRVPSCAEHNLRKSGEDQYFLTLLASCELINEVGKEHYRRKIRRQNARNPSIVYRFRDRSVDIDGRLGVKAEIRRLDSYVEQLAHALYFAHFGIRWHGDLRWIPEFLSRTLDADPTAEYARLASIEEIDQLFKEIPYHGDNPEVFAYQVLGSSAQCSIRLHFYGGCKIYLEFSAL